MARTSWSEAAPPVARICIATFPSAVASAGPARHSSSGGVRSQLVQQAILRSAADDTNLLDVLSTHLFQITKNQAVFECEAFQNGSYICAGFLRNWLMGSRAELVDGREHIRRAQEGLVIGIDEVTERRSRRRQFDQFAIVITTVPCAVQDCRQPCSIHRPMTFFNSLVVPFTPPSLVKFRRNASGVITGESSSVPSSDQVPELRKAVPSRADIAATAEPVS